ncbi:MAG: choice-of-anchor J domain-containing protein [Flavobacterium sp.]|nr:choice-of-anchor J domain-containing protein [Flavobacterium sp.]
MGILSRLSIWVFVSFSFCATAQTTILNQSLLTQGSFNSFTTASVAGVQNWYFNPQYGAVCSGYTGGTSQANEDWLISPMMNLSGADNVRLSFSHTRGNALVLNVGVAEGWYKVYATAAYTGDPTTTQWIEIDNVNHIVPVAWQYIPSGELIIPELAQSETSRIAFRYISSDTQNATWEIKNVKVTGVVPSNADSDMVFKITNWNTEWLGCAQNGPDNESLQLNNVVAAMLAMDSDVFCLQEVSNTNFNPSIATLVSLLGSDQWGGAIVPADTGECNQRQGIIYKKSKVQFLNSFQLSSGIPAQGGSYTYNWSNGRFPAVYNLDLITENSTISIYLVNIHAKAEDGQVSSYARRMGASHALKTILDGSDFSTENVVVIGDFNDYLHGTTSSACQCTDSPYKNFMDDDANYTGVTADITDVNTYWGVHPIIENVIISDELDSSFVSAAQDVAVAQSVANYYNTTSDHLPVSVVFNFTALSTAEHPSPIHNSWKIYPNPVSDELNIDHTGSMWGQMFEIFDFTGRKVHAERLTGSRINVAGLPVGIYIVKAEAGSGKFIKI